MTPRLERVVVELGRRLPKDELILALQPLRSAWCSTAIKWISDLRVVIARGEVLERSVVGEQARRVREATRMAREALVRQVA